MAVSEPGWWYGRGNSWQAAVLSPVAALYGAIARRRILTAKPYRSRLPVICIGNFTAGGSGKTPLALLIAKLVSENDREAWFLSRGYGGKLDGPVRIDLARHDARDVGDEPLLLARAFPTVVARDRANGAANIEKAASERAVIIMDDGLQNPSLAKDLSIAVVDARRGFGNGCVIPAGPLRAPLDVQAKLVQLVVLMGGNSKADHSILPTIRGLTDAQVVFGETQPDNGGKRLNGRKVLAFAGIANPARFFSSLKNLGADIVATRAFADHHFYSEAEAQDLLSTADRLGAALVTTEKDFVRLDERSGFCADLKSRSETLAIATVIEGGGMEVLRQTLRDMLERYRYSQ
ncbi:MAG: tetraacyldisaccharide 4'-kinase [Proteobacteria bacterium]|nr:tetraacyldisaccharide 4'-kinase [Pseudomonadota bacterium]